jgi:GNAT superfamily N-acetyltransferase
MSDVGRAWHFELRDAVAADAGEVAELSTAAWQSAYAEILPAGFLAAMDGSAREERLRERISDPNPACFTLVAGSGGRCVGFVSGGPVRAAACGGEVYAIYVAPDQCGRGVGSSLLRAAEARLADACHAEARLWVFTRNRGARRFYERCGWRAEAGRAYWRRDGLRRQLTCYSRSLVKGARLDEARVKPAVIH